MPHVEILARFVPLCQCLWHRHTQQVLSSSSNFPGGLPAPKNTNTKLQTSPPGPVIFFFRNLWKQEPTSKQYLILDVATAEVKRADGAATQPVQTLVCQSLTITQVEMVQFTQPDKLCTHTHKPKRAAVTLFNRPQWDMDVCVWSHIPLCNPHNGYVSDVNAVTDIQLSQFGGRGSFSQALYPNITHPEIQTINPLRHTM